TRGSSLPNLEQSKKRFLRDFHPSHLLHPLLAFLLLLEELALARDVATVAFRGDVLAQRLDAFARDDLRSDTGLNRNLKHLAGNKLAHLFTQRAASFVGLVTMHDYRKSVDHLTVNPDVQFNQRPRAEVQKLIVEGRVAAADGFQAVIEVEHDLGQR